MMHDRRHKNCYRDRYVQNVLGGAGAVVEGGQI